jgi:hypothetical protein
MWRLYKSIYVPDAICEWSLEVVPILPAQGARAIVSALWLAKFGCIYCNFYLKRVFAGIWTLLKTKDMFES